MDAELTVTIVACGVLGLGLGYGNLVLDFLRAPKLAVTIKNASIRAAKAGVFDYQVDLDISAKKKTIQLKEIEISHPVGIFDPATKLNNHLIQKLVAQPNSCLLDQPSSTFPGQLETLLTHAFKVVSVSIAPHEQKPLALIERISATQWGDGYWDWPSEGWTLTVRTNIAEIKLPFSFSVHSSNEINAFCINYDTTPTQIWSC